MQEREEYLGISIHKKPPEYLNDASEKLLKEFYLREGETVPQALARPAVAFSYGDMELAQAIYEDCYNGFAMYASPELSNAPLGQWDKNTPWHEKSFWDNTEEARERRLSFWKGEAPGAMPISCFLVSVGDSIAAQVSVQEELALLSVAGGGVGLHNEIRAASKKAPGPIPYMKALDGTIGYYRQSATRRGSLAYYMDVSHPDIMEHIKFRVPSGGDSARKADNRKQFFNAVNITDEFKNAVLKDTTFDLRCPHTGEVRDTVRAREIWDALLETAALTGAPYLFKIDEANRRMPETQKRLGLSIKGSNLCVAGDTKVLTRSGWKDISALQDKEVEVWNGEVFSKTVVKKTAEDQQLVEVVTSSGQSLRCTPYHKFYVQDKYQSQPREVRAGDLKRGDRLIKFELPVIPGKKTLSKAYTNGFFSGDGCRWKSRNIIYLYNEKKALLPYIEGVCWKGYDYKSDRIKLCCVGLKEKFFVPGAEYTIQDRLAWFAGLSDADGTVARNGDNESLQICSVNLEFLREVQLMLQTVGVTTKITKMVDSGDRLLPKNDGSGELGLYHCQDAYRLLVSSSGLYELSRLGFQTHRLKWQHRKPQRCAEQFIQVMDVTPVVGVEDVYCFSEPLRHMGMFNGLLTGNCNEISLPTDSERTAVCCLASVNLEYFPEWRDKALVARWVRFLDNVLQYFIDNSGLHKAAYSAMRERALGLGAMGWHYYLQRHNIPFEGGGVGSAIQHTNIIFSHIQSEAEMSSRQLAKERGEAPDMAGTGLRNSRRTAIAPNSNNSIILGTSPSIEPLPGVTYPHSTRAGTFLVRNKYFAKLLESKIPDEKAREVEWRRLEKNEGSVEDCHYLSEEEKAVFRDAYSIDQHWVVEQADWRQRYLCQLQSLNLFFPAGCLASYFNSVHLKWLKAENVYGRYYTRMKREGKVSVNAEMERKALKDWSAELMGGEECVGCSA